MKVAIVHDWLVSQRGGENVLDAICELFPQADLYTLVYVPGAVSYNIMRLKRHTSFLQKFPHIEERYRYFLPLMPTAIERFDMSEYDLIVSSSHCVAKGVRKREGALHVSYIHAPMRYMWDRFDEYFSVGRAGFVTRAAARVFRSYLQNWDRRSAQGVDVFMANSRFIAARIQELYGRQSQVVYPFCDTEKFSAKPRQAGTSYLMVTALVPYKRVDLAVDAFQRSGRSLYIVGDGPDRKRLEKSAGPTITFLGSLKSDSLMDLYSKCRGLVFPGVEDFGIVPVEAMAAGMPVIAFGKGGATETVIAGETGLFFQEPTVESLLAALQEFESRSWSEEACRRRGGTFTRARFQEEFLAVINKAMPVTDNFVKTLQQAPREYSHE